MNGRETDAGGYEKRSTFNYYCVGNVGKCQYFPRVAGEKRHESTSDYLASKFDRITAVVCARCGTETNELAHSPEGLVDFFRQWHYCDDGIFYLLLGGYVDGGRCGVGGVDLHSTNFFAAAVTHPVQGTN